MKPSTIIGVNGRPMFLPHPECGENETFVGNFRAEKSPLVQLKTARLGKIAYDVYGDPLPVEFGPYLPLFIGNSDMAEYGRIMTNRFNRIKDGYGDKKSEEYPVRRRARAF